MDIVVEPMAKANAGTRRPNIGRVGCTQPITVQIVVAMYDMPRYCTDGPQPSASRFVRGYYCSVPVIQ